jgi:glycosyltransferase involved in cell wall biosynthesis
VTGVLFRADSREAFVEAASRLGQEEDLRARLGAQARAFAVREREWTEIVGRYRPLYESLV